MMTGFVLDNKKSRLRTNRKRLTNIFLDSSRQVGRKDNFYLKNFLVFIISYLLIFLLLLLLNGHAVSYKYYVNARRQ